MCEHEYELEIKKLKTQTIDLSTNQLSDLPIDKWVWIESYKCKHCGERVFEERPYDYNK